MAGFVGIVSRERTADHAADLAVMLQSVKDGPSAVSGASLAPETGVYVGWVAHPGSFAYRQSHLATNGIDVGFTGECVNEATSQQPHNSNDSIAGLYRRYGDNFVERLNGLFSGFIFDRSARRLLIFNDRYGTERIYYHEAGGNFYFASEAKALLRILPQLRAFDEQGVAQFLAFGCTLESRTLFRGIRLLPGASAWSFEGQRCSKRRYFLPETWEAQSPLSADLYERELRQTFEQVLPRYTQADGKLGISLTGGFDTRMIMACLPVLNSSCTCYTFASTSGLTLDARLASKVASSLGLEHRTLRIGPDFLQNFDTYFDKTVYATDGCAGALSSHEIYFNAQARQLSPVRLTGNFGSEILRSVSTFKPLGLHPPLLADSYAKAVDAEIQEVANDSVHPVTFAAFREIPWNLFGLLAAGRSQVTFRTPYLDNDLVALAYRAPAKFRRSSLPALHLIEKANPQLARIPTDRGELLHSSVFTRAVRRGLGEVTFKIEYYNSEGLPRFLSAFDPILRQVSSTTGILGLHKFLSYPRWFRNELAPAVMERITSDRVRHAPWWAKNTPEALARGHISRKGNYQHELSTILTLEAIERLFFSEIAAKTPAEKQDIIESVRTTAEAHGVR
jgi:asparagine synthase (glutamine-hydrolysing)